MKNPFETESRHQNNWKQFVGSGLDVQITKDAVSPSSSSSSSSSTTTTTTFSTLSSTMSVVDDSSSSFSLSSTFSTTYPIHSAQECLSMRFPPSLSTFPDPKVCTFTNGVDYNGSRQQRRRKIPSQIMLAILSLNRDKVVWEEMEDDLYILLDGKLDRLMIYKQFFQQNDLTPKKKCALLKSLSYLLSSNADDMTMYDEHVSRIASFLSTGRDLRHLKLAVLKTLNMCLLTPTLSLPLNVHEESAIPELMFEFFTVRNKEWDMEHYQTSAITLLYEIRAKSLRELDLERERIRRVAHNGENTAVLIATGAKLVEFGIQKSNRAIEGQISNAGSIMKSYIDVDDQRLVVNRDAVVVRAFSGSTKRVSLYARDSSKIAAQSALDATLSGLYTIGNKLKEGGLTENISPERREKIEAVKKVGMATVGAVVLVSEAIMQTSRSVSAKAAEVTIDVVGHKYGPAAGEVAQDAADTYTNVLETMGNVALMGNGSKLAQTVAQNVGKEQIEGDVDKAKKIIINLERQGAVMIKKHLGIQWQSNWTKDLCASEDENQDNADRLLQNRKSNLMVTDVAERPGMTSAPAFMNTNTNSIDPKENQCVVRSSSYSSYEASVEDATGKNHMTLTRSFSTDGISSSIQRSET